MRDIYQEVVAALEGVPVIEVVIWVVGFLLIAVLYGFAANFLEERVHPQVVGVLLTIGGWSVAVSGADALWGSNGRWLVGGCLFCLGGIVWLAVYHLIAELQMLAPKLRKRDRE